MYHIAEGFPAPLQSRSCWALKGRRLDVQQMALAAAHLTGQRSSPVRPLESLEASSRASTVSPAVQPAVLSAVPSPLTVVLGLVLLNPCGRTGLRRSVPQAAMTSPPSAETRPATRAPPSASSGACT